MPDLAEIRDGWNQAAREDALFNIITDSRYANGGWPEEEFFTHGRIEIATLLARLDTLELRGPHRSRALDFGCGVGRLTQALADEYDDVDGVDISQEMVDRARLYNRTRGWLRHRGQCIFHVTNENLGRYSDGLFDLIYSMIVLQHMPSELQHGYVSEFIRLLAPGGLAVFQIPEGPDCEHVVPWLSMFGTPHATVEEWVTEAGARVRDVEATPSQPWISYRYTVSR